MRRSSKSRSILPETLESRRLLSSSAALTDTGITGEYFIGDDFQTATVVRTDSRINFNFPNRTPDATIPKGVFTARWTGTLTAPTTGVYTFLTASDSGTQVIINGTTVIDNFAARTASTQQGTISLTAGQAVPIQVEYVSRGNDNGKMQFLWATGGSRPKVVPQTAFVPATGVTLPADQPLVGTYYTGRNFKEESIVRDDKDIDYNFGTGVPDAAIPLNTPFSVKWFGTILAPTTAVYTFETITDDGVRLFINGQKIIGDWGVHSAKSDFGKIQLQAGQYYNVEMEYFQDGVGHGEAGLLSALKGHTPKFTQFTEPPVALTAPLDVTATAFSSSQINLNWGDVSGETGFTIERSSDGGATFSVAGTTAQGVTTFSDTGLTPATSYVYEVIATEGSNVSPASAEATASTESNAPAAPVASATVSGTTATISWASVSGATGYTVQRSTSSSTGFTQIGTTSTTSLPDNTLAGGTTYYYEVSASNTAGASAASNVVSVTTVPAAPTLSASASSDTQINLTWTDVTGETGFIVQQSANGSGGWTQVGSTAAGITTLPVPGLSGSTAYHFRVIAVDATGDSSPSNVASATTSAPPPTYSRLTTIYGLTGNALVYTLNTSSGAVTQIGSLSFGTNAAGRDPISGDFYYVAVGSSTPAISAWDPTDGTNHVITTATSLDGSVALAAFRDDGTFFVATSVGDLYGINRSTGNATLEGTFTYNGSTLATTNGDLAFGPDGNLYIFTNGKLYSASGSTIAAATGSGYSIPTTVVASPGLGTLQIAFGQNGSLYGESSSGQLYEGSDVNGPVTAVGSPSGVTLADLASVPLNADLSIAQTPSAFTKGQTGTYTINVTNSGPDDTVGPIQVVDTLPAGLSFVSGSGTGWTFSTSGSVVTMTYAGSVHSGAIPAAILTVQVASTATSPVVNVVTVSTTIFDQDTSNNSSSTVSSVLS